MSNNFKITIWALFAIIIISIFAYIGAFGAPQKQAELEQFTIPTAGPEDHNQKIIDDSREIAEKLKTEGFIKSIWAFNLALGSSPFSRCVDCTMPGAYKISKSMSVWEVAKVLKQRPYLMWVVIPEGLRKEEIADILASVLGWSDEEKDQWISVYTAMKFDETEGVYFPDTYLIPADEAPLEVADRLRAKFNEKFTSYSGEALKQNIKWDTLLKIASIVQREAAGKDDMPLIAGILWNRLLKDMKIEADATLQYARGDVGGGWWAPITLADKKIDSPYNTYKYAGLPPHPIASPGLDAIKAVLYPEETECLFYLHDESKKIHCAETYEEHQENIKTFLQ